MMQQEQAQLIAGELYRYNRHLVIPGFWMEAQQKLKNARVLVVGCGGLGSPVLLYLAAAGVGTLGLVDFDMVDESNLQRQVLFGTADIGRPKTEAARERLQQLNPHVNFVLHQARLQADNALDIINNYDVVADGTDNFSTRYLVNDACVLTGKPNVYASIFQFDGQVSVFNYRNGPNYRDLYPSPPPHGLVPDCAEGGVLGVLPGIIGSLQALEVIKVITGIGETLSGRLYNFDALSFTSRTFNIKRDPANPLNGEHPIIHALVDYDRFCGVNTIREISASELLQWRERGEDFQLIDVREPEEYREVNIGGDLIPVGLILSDVSNIARDKKVVIHCKSGGRSAKVIRELTEKYGFDNLYNLKGGIIAAGALM
jgi:adenylyltransferase/sulfurtransferase